jgi:hypothetical protein
MGQYSKVETDGHLMIVTINRPEVYNACHPMANQEMVEAFDEFQTNPETTSSITPRSRPRPASARSIRPRASAASPTASTSTSR